MGAYGSPEMHPALQQEDSKVSWTMIYCEKCGKAYLSTYTKCPHCNTKRRSAHTFAIVVLSILLAAETSFIAYAYYNSLQYINNSVGNTYTQAQKNAMPTNAAYSKETQETEQTVETPVSDEPITLSTGSYVVGVDFPAGKYNLTVVGGTGSITGTIMSIDYLNAIMGTEAANEIADIYSTEYYGLRLADGDSFEISGNLKISFARNK